MSINPEIASIADKLHLTTEEARVIHEKAVVQTFPKEAIILENGHHCDSLFFIIEGRVKVIILDSKGRESVLLQRGPGEYFGGPGFGAVPLSAMIMTVEPSRFLVLPKVELKAFLPNEHALLTQLFEQLVGELEEQGRELAEALQQKNAISEILRAISRFPGNLHSLLEAVAENAARLCDVPDADILQVDGDGLRLVAKYGVSKWWPVGAKRSINRNWVTGRAVIDRVPVHVYDLQAAEVEAEFPEGSAIAKKHGHRTTFATPLMREGSAVGAILIRRFEVRPLTDKQIALLMTFADQAAIVIENVRLLNEIQEKSRNLEKQAKELAAWNATLETRVADQVARLDRLTKLEHELSLASDIQKSMIPRSTPQLEGYEFCARMIPAKTVGGDFFDFIPLGKDSLAVAVGDVADKGIPAALFMAMVRSLLRAEIHPGHSPKEILERVNHHILDLNDKEMFVTLLLGILDRNAKRFTYARAGHEPPILIDEEGVIKPLPIVNGRALGVFNDIGIEEQEIDLHKNLKIILYTDGITDATNCQDKRFGYEGICRIVKRLKKPSAMHICNEIVGAVSQHRGGCIQFDDITLVVVAAV